MPARFSMSSFQTGRSISLLSPWNVKGTGITLWHIMTMLGWLDDILMMTCSNCFHLFLFCFKHYFKISSMCFKIASRHLKTWFNLISMNFQMIFNIFSICFISKKKQKEILKQSGKNKKFARMSWYGRVAFHMMLAPPMKMVTGRKLLAGNCVFVPQKAPADLTPLLVDWRRRWRRTGHGRPENWPESGDRPQSRKCCRVRQCVASRKNCCKWI